MKKLLLSIGLIFLASNSFAEDLRLNCIVNGEKSKSYVTTSGYESEKITNEKIDVLVMDSKNKLVIKIDSPDQDIQQLVTSVPIKNEKGVLSEVINRTDKNQYFLINIDNSEGTKFNDQVRIDRVMGKIYVKTISDGGKKSMSARVQYSGGCESFKNQNKF